MSLLRPLFLLLLAGVTPAYALPTGVNAWLSLTNRWDSNIDASAQGRSDSTGEFAVGLDLARNRGIISVSASLRGTWTSYRDHPEEDNFAPYFDLRLSKSRGGPLTGSLAVSASRDRVAEGLVNQRASSWQTPATLSLAYRLNQRTSLTSTTDYLERRFDQTDGLFVHSRSIAQSLGLGLNLNQLWQITASTRWRTTDMGAESSDDLALMVGLNRPVTSKLAGTLSGGIQRHNSSRGTGDSSVFARAGLTWRISRRWDAALDGTRDYTTSPTGSEVLGTTAVLSSAFRVNSRLSLRGGLATTRSDFLLEGRKDRIYRADAGISIAGPAKVKIEVTASQLRSSSSESLGRYRQQVVSVSLRRAW